MTDRSFNEKKIDKSSEFFNIKHDKTIIKIDSPYKSMFPIDPLELESLMGKYKERGNDFQDLKYFENENISQLLIDLKTDQEKGISSVEARE